MAARCNDETDAARSRSRAYGTETGRENRHVRKGCAELEHKRFKNHTGEIINFIVYLARAVRYTVRYACSGAQEQAVAVTARMQSARRKPRDGASLRRSSI